MTHTFPGTLFSETISTKAIPDSVTVWIDMGPEYSDEIVMAINLTPETAQRLGETLLAQAYEATL